MKDIRERLLSKIDELSPDHAHRGRYAQFVNLLFSRKPSGNKVLMMGVDDKELIIDLLGVSADEIIKEEASYPVQIKKCRTNEDKIIITFKDPQSKLGTSEIDAIHDLFSYYGHSKNEYDLSLANNRIPPLVIKDTQSFLTSSHKTIKVLSAKGLIDIIDIYSSIENHKQLHDSIDEVLILTKSFSVLIDTVSKNAQNDNQDEYEEVSPFWVNFQKTVRQYDRYNFVILNNSDEYLIKSYIELIGLMEEQFKLSESDRLILKRMFIVTEQVSPLFYESRYFKDGNSKLTKYALPNMYSDINDVDNDTCDAQLLTCFLNIIHNENLSEDDCVPLQNQMELMNSYQQNLNNIIQNQKEEITNLIDKFPTLLNEIQEQIQYAHNKLSKTDNRTIIVNNFKALMSNLKDFAEKYCSSMVAEVYKADADFEEIEAEMTKTHNAFLIGETYSMKNSTFNEKEENFISCANDLFERMKQKVQIALLERDINDLDNKVASMNADLRNGIKELTSMEQAVLKLLISIESQHQSIEKYINEIKNLHERRCSVASLQSDEMRTLYNSYTNAILMLTEKEEHFGAEIERHNKDFKAIEALKTMLMDALFQKLMSEPCETNDTSTPPIADNNESIELHN